MTTKDTRAARMVGVDSFVHVGSVGCYALAVDKRHCDAVVSVLGRYIVACGTLVATLDITGADVQRLVRGPCCRAMRQVMLRFPRCPLHSVFVIFLAPATAFSKQH